MTETQIKVGLLKTTTVNFPGHLATAVFLPGCNLRCDYCYNVELACADVNGFSLVESTNEYVNLAEVFAHLEKRQNVIKALAISGGEPFASPHLKILLDKASSLNYKIKIDTNGLFPERLKDVLALYPNISMIALDIKTALSRYYELLPNKNKSAKLETENKLHSTIAILKEAESTKRIDCEYRTVLIPGLVGKSEIANIAELLPKNANWQFANFLFGNCMNPSWNKISPYTDEQLSELLSYAKSFIPNATLR